MKEAGSGTGIAVPCGVVQLCGPQNCEWKQEGWGFEYMRTSGTREWFQGRLKQLP